MAKTTNKKGTTTPPLVDENDVSTAVKANSPDKKQSLANSPDKKQPLVSAITAGKTSATATTRAASKGRTSSQAHLATITHGAANAERPHRPVMQP